MNEAVKKLELVFSKPFKGRNENRMYNIEIEYNSLIFEDKGTIKIKFGIQETVLETEDLKAKIFLADSITQKPVLPDFLVKGLSLKESYNHTAKKSGQPFPE